MRAGLRVLAVFVAVAAFAASAESQALNVDDLLTRVGSRIAEFYNRAQNVICTEKSVVQQIGLDLSPSGMARFVESELHVEPDAGDGPGEAKVVREIRKVNGRVPRERDKKDRSACMDPNPLSTEPLAFLLPAHREEYVFTAAGSGKDRNRDTLLIDFATRDRRTKLELIEDPSGHDDCYDWVGPVARAGRIWVDAASYDVVRVDERFKSRVDVSVPFTLQRRHQFSSFVVIERYDTTVRYKTVSFDDPAEALLLPESIDSLVIIHGGLASARRSHTFSDYRRFLTGGRVVK